MQSIQKDIDKYRNGFATVAEEAGFFKQLFLFCNRNKVMCGLVTAFALILSMVIYSYIEDIKQSQKRYRAEKEKAEEALALYKQGEREKQIINKDFTEFLVHTTKLNKDHFDMDKGLMIINLAVDKDPENVEAWLRKGYIHFIRHEFEEAHKALELSKESDEDVQTLKKMSQENFGNEGLLSPDETVGLMKRLPVKFKSMMMYFVAYDSKQRQSLTDHSVVVKNMLEHRNGSSDFRFHYDESKRSLSLANNPSLAILDDMPLESLKSFYILKTLKLRTLNLSNTAVSNLEHLRGLEELEELNLEKTLVLDLRPLTVLKSLKKVILSTNLKRLTKGQWPFQIVYSDKSGNNSVIEQQISRILKRFDDLDKDQSQTLSLNELSVLVPKESVMYFSKVLGIDKNGSLSLSEIERVKQK
ncbi:MAG: hypothetical protein MK132_25800 [Lentisphaerales bacterium]|nr:hypothetical protein [Lentisphaerales bacterium]